MKKTILILSAVAAISGLSSCKHDGFDKNENGLLYKFHTKKDGPKPKEGDVMTLNMVYKTDKDSVLFDTYKQGKPVEVPLMKPAFKGAIEEGFAMLSPGDSATFKVLSDSLFIKTFHMDKLPPFIKSGSMVTFVVKMEKMQSRAEAEAAYEKQKSAAMKQMEERKSQEPAEIENYVKANNVKVKPSAKGIYAIVNKAGTGAQAADGKMVTVQYTGKFLDGRTFDTSVGKGKPFEFKLGEGQVIPGWEEAIKTMKAGGKSTFIIPSELAYGAQGAGGVIPPYTPLLFDVELVEVK